MRSTRTLRAAVLIAALLAVACSGDDDEAAPTATTTSAPATTTTPDPTAAEPPELRTDVEDPVVAMASLFAFEEWSNFHPERALGRLRDWIAAGSELEDRTRRTYGERVRLGVQEGGRRELLEMSVEGGVVVRHATMRTYVKGEPGALVAADGTRTEIAPFGRTLVVYELFLARDGRWRLFDKRVGDPSQP